MTDSLTEKPELTSRSATALHDALALVEQGLTNSAHRSLISGDEVTDLLLDLRALLKHFESSAVEN